jgi:DNA-binding transcriptional LysR family regulator
MKLTSLDLNLLVVLRALLEERHVTRAGERVGLTQPAMSNSLKRLRALFGDELLVRTPHGMELTHRAMALAGPLRAALDHLEQALGGESFVPKASHRTFALAMADYTALVVLPALKRHLSHLAPRIELVVINSIRGQGLRMVDHGEADLAVGMLPEVPPHLRKQDLYHDRLVCMARADHPAMRRPLTLPRYAKLPHVVVCMPGNQRNVVDRELELLGFQRRIEVVVPHHLLVPPLLAGTDLVATEAQRVSICFLQMFPLATRPPPFNGPTITISQAWHIRSDHDPAHRWLRQQIATVTSTL